MTTVNHEPLWRPDPQRIARAQVTKFHTWAAEQHGAPSQGGYPALHRWSVDEPETFWKAVTEWFDVRFSTPYARVLGDRSMPGAQWFPGATLNYAEHALRAAATRPAEPALLHVDETHEPRPVTWAELRRQVGSLAAELRALGVRPGDRVSGYLPNVPQAVVALLATAAVGGAVVVDRVTPVGLEVEVEGGAEPRVGAVDGGVL
ncbi:acetyl-coenzyme A synthetase N-terminal domain-containing protein, partial [Streptomyces asoensis]|uniref:AMP-binding protein n=1 Tax=Streptomyces asoensis TaxID=249586 RepID=UPI003402F1E8